MIRSQQLIICGVGTFAVQIAKTFGAEVTGVCRTENLDMVRALGADDVVDYTKENFIEKGQKYDLIIDIVANHTFSDYKAILTETGTCVMVGFSTYGNMINTGINSFLSRKKQQTIRMLLAKNAIVTDLIQVGELVKEKKVTPVIDKIFPLEDISKAFQYFEAEHIKGKVIISINRDETVEKEIE